MKTQTLGFLIVLVLLSSLAIGACGLMLSTLPFGGQVGPLPDLAGTLTPGPVIIQPTATVEVPPPTPTPLPPTPIVTVDPTLPGTVAGKICFPSQVVPQMVAYFEEVNTGALVTLPIAANQTSYLLQLPAGIYEAYAWLPEFGELGGSYSESVKCGLSVSCTDHTLIRFEVRPGQVTSGIDICDWYGGQGTVPYPPTYNPPQPTAVPTAAPTATPTAIPVPCEWAQFVKDISVPDNSVFKPGTAFTKTWRIQNRGACTWTTEYALVFTSGDALGAEKVVRLPGTVAPGASIDISVKMTAPKDAGTYRGYWMLRNASGVLFGLGESAKSNLWVSIEVKAPRTRTVLNFAQTYCEALWQSGAGVLPCATQNGRVDGFVSYLENPALENRNENEPALWVRPNLADDGWISGIYAPFKVKDGDRFRAWVGCMADSEGCKVEFRLDYQKHADGPVKNLGTWRERYDGDVTMIDLDLSELEGKEVRFILSVRVLKNVERANAFWFVPRIDRISE